jgi:CBS domain-containing protein
MWAAEFMTADVVTATPEMPVREAIRLLLDSEVAALPVLDDRGRLVGIVSELDALRHRVAEDPRAHAAVLSAPDAPPPRTVAEVMTEDVVALTDADDQAAFATLMALSGVRSVPVVRGERLVGIVSRRDLLRVLLRDDERIADDVRAALAEAGPAVGSWRVEVSDGFTVLTGTGSAAKGETARTVAVTVPGVTAVRVHLTDDLSA